MTLAISRRIRDAPWAGCLGLHRRRFALVEEPGEDSSPKGERVSAKAERLKLAFAPE
jgi:hypothetical protein